MDQDSKPPTLEDVRADAEKPTFEENIDYLKKAAKMPVPLPIDAPPETAEEQQRRAEAEDHALFHVIDGPPIDKMLRHIFQAANHWAAHTSGDKPTVALQQLNMDLRGKGGATYSPSTIFTAPSLTITQGEHVWTIARKSEANEKGENLNQNADPLSRFEVKIGAEAFLPNLADNWMVKGVVMLKGTSAIYGKPGSGKSFIAISMGLHIAAGRQWMGRDVEQKVVVYAALEGGAMFSNRLAAAKIHHGLTEYEQAHFATINVSINLRDTATGTALRDCLHQIEEQTQSKIGLVVIDTLNRAFGGGNENSPEDMGALITEVGKIEAALNCNVLLVHHSGKDIAQGMRGHSSLLAAIDTEMLVEKNDAGRLLKITKQKDGDDDVPDIGFRLETVEIGQTPKGEPVTSAVAVSKDASEIKAAAKKEPQGANQKVLMQALQQLAAEPGVARNPAGPGWPEGGRFAIVSANDLLNHAKGKLTPPEDGKKDRRRETMSRVLKGMIESGALCQNEGMVWSPTAPKAGME